MNRPSCGVRAKPMRPVVTMRTPAERRLYAVLERWAWIVAGEDAA